MSTGISHIIKTLEITRESVAVDGLRGGAKALLLARLSRAMPKRTVLVITPTADRATQLVDDCRVFFCPEDIPRIALFPQSSVLPYSRLSPEPEDWADRIHVLHRLIGGEALMIIAPVDAVMRRVPPRKFIAEGCRSLGIGDAIDIEDLTGYLADSGYEDAGLVEDEGLFARRGGIIDVWPPTIDKPMRIELDGERIASMRYFDPATQRSQGDGLRITLIPVRDIPFDRAGRNLAAHRIRERSDRTDIPARERRRIIEQIHQGVAFLGIETLMPLFHESTSTVLDYIPPGSLIVTDEETDVESTAASHYEAVLQLAADTRSPEKIIDPDEIIASPSTLGEEIARFSRMRWNALPLAGERTHLIATGVLGNEDLRHLVAVHKEGVDMLSPLADRIRQWQAEGKKIVLTCHTPIQAERLADLFRRHGIDIEHFDAPFATLAEMKSSSVRLRLGRLSAGFRWPYEGLAVITDEEIFGSKVQRRSAPSRPLEAFTSLAELAEGDFIVHEQHGIGRYRGLSHLRIEDKPGDYLLLEYLGGDRLYLPVYRLNLVGKYIGSGDAPPPLDKLGGFRWSRIKKQVNSAIRLMAKELLQIYASREVYPGFSFPGRDAAYEEFAAAFPYDETPDQSKAVDDIMRDMSIERPMDRLICGDVGYGKTEVAMRAAFRAAMSGKQVAVLVPTTVLALQHYETFTKRFAETPVVIEMLSRFRKSKGQKATIEGMRRGTVDIVIGTHRLLQKDVAFKDLGLLIIDEEHRFGVRHKERIKKLRATVDVLTLTATPIPRTLNLSLTGVRDISIINTPPANRLSISTYVAPFDEGIVRQAIIHELARSGQVFFVHNRVETIGSMHMRLRELVPEARIVVGHGQLRERELEKAMIDFIERRADMLLCTTIIESGLDIPTANTIVINRSDTFGLAELYQLRGRVGRSNVRAYAYLLTPSEGTMTALAKKRLAVLKRFTELGSGFQIAMHDLEFRGAGNILGRAQSGHVAAVGYEMYAKLLDREVRRLTGKPIEEEIDPELHLKVAAFLPDDYVEDPGTRIDLYRRLASRESTEEVTALGEELADRFGHPPPEVKNLIDIMEIKVLARRLRIKQITFDGAQFSCQLDSQTPLGTEKIVSLVSQEPGGLRLVPHDRLLILARDVADEAQILKSAKNSLSRLLNTVKYSN